MIGIARIIMAVSIFTTVSFACYLAGAVVLLFFTGTGPGAEKTVGLVEPLIIAASGLVAVVAVVAVDRAMRRAQSSN